MTAVFNAVGSFAQSQVETRVDVVRDSLADTVDLVKTVVKALFVALQALTVGLLFTNADLRGRAVQGAKGSYEGARSLFVNLFNLFHPKVSETVGKFVPSFNAKAAPAA